MKQKNKTYLYELSAYIWSVLGALGVAIQNYLGALLFIQALLKSTTKSVMILVQTTAISLGGICSGMVNFLMNIDLLKAFFQRITGKKQLPPLTKGQTIRLYVGSAIFIISGILFGLTAFTFGMTSPLSVLAIIAGIFVAGIMIVQELETWLDSFQQENVDEQQTLTAIFHDWLKKLNLKKGIGYLIALGNVMALSLLFTLGLAQCAMMLGIAALPAFIIGITISFTIGAFTEFYFYNAFLSKFCENIVKKWTSITSQKYAPIGISLAALNALVNGALTYSGVQLLSGLFISAGLSAPALGSMIALCAICALFAASASFILGIDFWIKWSAPAEEATFNSSQLAGLGERKVRMSPPAPVLSNTTINFALNDALTPPDSTHPKSQNPPASL